MTEYIVPGQSSSNLIKKISEIDSTVIEPLQVSPFDPVDKISIQSLNRWFASRPQENKRIGFAIESLNATLLQDLYDSITEGEPPEKKEPRKPSWSAKLTFGLLVIAGTIYFACEGFDGVSALMGVFSLPPLPIFLVGIAFSALSILIFYTLELLSISNSLGIQFKRAPRIIDLYLKELRLMKQIRKKLADTFFLHDRRRLEDDLLMINLLINRQKYLELVKTDLKNASQHWGLRVAKIITATLPGLIFFSAGFFAGQTVAISIASLFVAAVAPTFWPIILASVLVGIASLTIYWILQRPGIENIAGMARGLDKEKLDELTSEKRGEQELNELNKLAANIALFKASQPRLNLELEFDEENPDLEQTEQRACSSMSTIVPIPSLQKGPLFCAEPPERPGPGDPESYEDRACFSHSD